ncbi:Serine/threonine-protein kinase PknK [Nocardia cerradoensis]|uniref:Serine/threonine-protein kinase PknK n=2 Tax=Nocardia cerradoensis TaxID=85688 RepID=A0A231H3E6_9NOCA|nr:Serine/threonine-protein kinase PknK [Nocardia cerradoensis]
MADKDSMATQRDRSLVIDDDLRAAGFADAHIIGRGGFGVVYRCRELALGRTVAVKVLTATSEFGDENLERFLREQRAMGGLPEHPNIVAILQVGTTGDGRPYLVMPYHPKGSLDQRIQHGGPLDVTAALRMSVKLSGALETVHRAGILHRDIKPGNVLLSDYGEPQLTDFGIARVEGGFRTTTGVVTASPAFTAPEVLRDGTPTVASDIYSLGATLFCMLTGHAAFQRRSGERLVAQFVRITEEPIPDLRPGGIPDDTCALIEDSMAADPAQRPVSAAEFGERAQQLQRHRGLRVDEMAIPAPEPPAAEPAAVADRVGEPTRLGLLPPADPVTTPPTAETKFHPALPARPLVRRPRLLDSMDRDRWPRLIVVHAPAGFGKSTLAAQWGQRMVGRGVATCWLNIDDDDNNPVWFLLHLIEAVGRARPALTTELLRVVEEHGNDVMRYVLTTLINRIHADGERIVMIIEDWHRVTDADTTAALRFLLDNACHHLQLLITSREMIGLPLSAIRVRDDLIEIDSAALRFDQDETADFLTRVGGLTLDSADIDRLRSGTDGWVAGLQLASISLRGREDPGSAIATMSGRHQAISEYLTDNVLDALEPDLLTALLDTAVTDKVCGSLASELTGRPQGRALLEDIERRDLFLRRLDDDGEWFRYHTLFSDFLRQRLERDHPDRVPRLHRRAAEWFAAHDMLSEAIDHAMAAGDPGRAVALVSAHARELVQHSHLATLAALAAKLPVTEAAADPTLQIALAWAAVLLRRPSRMHTALQLALAADSAKQPPGHRKSDLAVEASILCGVEAALADRLDGLEDIVEQSCARADSLAPFVLSAAANLGAFTALHRFDFDRVHEWHRWGRTYFRHITGALSIMYSHCFAGMAAREQLDSEAAEEHFRTALHLARTTTGESSLTARLASAALGDFLYDRGEIAEARHLLGVAVEFGFDGGTVDFLTGVYGTGARIEALRGDLAAARRLLADGTEVATAHTLPRLSARIELERIRLGFAESGPGEPPAPHGARDGVATTIHDLTEEAAVRWLLCADPERALPRARDLRESIDTAVRPRAALCATLLFANCLETVGRSEEAETVLAPALRRCVEAGLVRPLIDEGPALLAVARRLSGETGRHSAGTPAIALPRTFLDQLG